MKKISISVLLFILFGSLALHAGWLLEPEGEMAAQDSKQNSTATAAQPKTNTPASQTAVTANVPVPPVQPVTKYEVALINLKKSEGGSVTVSWQNPVSIQGYSLKVYRDIAVLDSENKIVDSKIIARLDPPAASYVDKPLSAGKYFYAVTVTYNGTEYKGLTPDVSYTSFGVNGTPVVAAVTPVLPPAPAVPSPVNGLQASLQNNNEVALSWTVVSANTNVSYNVYRANRQMNTANDLALKVIKTANGKFTETVTEPGSYFYAVTTVSSAGENRKILPGTNSLLTAIVIAPKPVVIAKAPEPEKPAVTLKTQIRVIVPTLGEVKPEPVLKEVKITEPVVEKITKPYGDILLDVKRSSYYEERYQMALVTLKSLASDADCPDDVKNEAELFIGKCYYQLGRYSEAIKSLVKVKKFFPEEADFWISRAADKL